MQIEERLKFERDPKKLFSFISFVGNYRSWSRAVSRILIFATLAKHLQSCKRDIFVYCEKCIMTFVMKIILYQQQSRQIWIKSFAQTGHGTIQCDYFCKVLLVTHFL